MTTPSTCNGGTVLGGVKGAFAPLTGCAALDSSCARRARGDCRWRRRTISSGELERHRPRSNSDHGVVATVFPVNLIDYVPGRSELIAGSPSQRPTARSTTDN
jgi:hypothetical protein